MSDYDKPEHLKELIRIKNVELKKLEGSVGKQEEKIQHLVTTTQKRIKDLQTRIEEQNEEIRYHQKHTTDLLRRKQTEERQHSEEVSSEEIQTQKFRYDKALQFLQELRAQNAQLTLRLDHEAVERERLTKEKGLLAREIQRLRTKPDITVDDKIKTKVEELENRMEEAQKRFDGLLKEKDDLIASYEETIHEVSGSPDVSPTTYKQARRELDTLQREKKRLENTLARERRMFKARLSKDIRFLEEEIEQRTKKKLLWRKKHTASLQEISEDNIGEGWMTTYADMVTLLLTFFVLYYSIARVQVDKIKNTLIGQSPGGANLVSMIEQTEDMMTLETLAGLAKDTLEAELKEFAEEVREHQGVSITGQKNRILIQVPGEALFPSGSADLNLEASKQILQKIADIAKQHPTHNVRILGHTDDVPISTSQFPTNWELSSARAAAVLRYFLDKNIPPQRLSSSGYADTFPIANNDTEMGRKKNRRVEIVLEKEG